MLSTILFIDDAPVGYRIHQEGEQLLITPTLHSLHLKHTPLLSLTKVDGLWLLNERVDPSLRVQVLQSLERFRAGGLLV